jgi:hypothetical protein
MRPAGKCRGNVLRDVDVVAGHRPTAITVARIGVPRRW